MARKITAAFIVIGIGAVMALDSTTSSITNGARRQIRSMFTPIPSVVNVGIDTSRVVSDLNR